MEHKLQRYFKTFEHLGAFPYNFKLIPGTLDYTIKLKHGLLNHKAWNFYVISIIIHLAKIAITLALNFEGYLANLQYFKLIYTCLWCVILCSIISQTLPQTFGRVEMMQLGNGATLFMRNLEEGKAELNYQYQVAPK